jgi:CheY-like chemotaxis protein
VAEATKENRHEVDEIAEKLLDAFVEMQKETSLLVGDERARDERARFATLEKIRHYHSASHAAAVRARLFELAPARGEEFSSWLRGLFGMVRLLLVDDEPAFARALQRALTGYAIERASDGEEARQRLAEGEVFDLILSDVRMPRLGGLALLRWIRAHAPAFVVRCVFMTFDPDDLEAQEIARTHVHPVLHKPCTRDMLEEVMESAGVAIPVPRTVGAAGRSTPVAVTFVCAACGRDIRLIGLPDDVEPERANTLVERALARHAWTPVGSPGSYSCGPCWGMKRAAEEGVEALAQILIDAFIQIKEDVAGLDGEERTREERARFAEVESIRMANPQYADAVRQRLFELAATRGGDPFFAWMVRLFDGAPG